MKKYLLLLITAISFGQASNQMVSFTQAQSLGFSLKAGQSHTLSDKCMTKTEALTKYNLDASAMSSYAPNQLVPKSVWVSGVVNYVFYYAGSFNDRASACSYVSDYSVFYSNTSTLSEGSIVYTNPSLTNVFVGNGAFYLLSDTGSTAIINSSGVVSSILTCSPTYYTHLFGNSSSYDPMTSCLLPGTGLTLYAVTVYLDFNTILYTDSTLTTEFNGGETYWNSSSNGGNSYEISFTGEITSINLCN